MQTLLQDLRYAVRILRKQPGFALVVVLTLALGIGTNAAIFSIVNAVLLRPLPYRAPDRLVALWETDRNEPDRRMRSTAANTLDWQSQNDVFADVAMFGSGGGNLTGGGDPEQLLGARVSEDYFRVLGVEPMLGRSFTPEEQVPGADRVIIIYYDLWQRRFGGTSDAIGQTLRLDDTPHTIVGVMPPGIYPTWPATQGYIPFLPRYQQVWTPLALSPERAATRTSHVYGTIARLNDGVALEQAQAQMDTIAVRLERQYPAANRDEGVVVVPLVDEVVGDVLSALFILLGAVGLVLLVACANLASLMLARSVARQKEIAIRTALGAGRGRLVRQLVAESLLLATLGGIAGLGLAYVGIDLLTTLTPQDIPRLSSVGIDPMVLGFALATTAVTGALFGLLPAMGTSRADLHHALKEGGRADVRGGRDRFRRGLVAAEVSVAVLLVIGAGLLIKSFWNLQRVDPGFDPTHTLTFSVALPEASYLEAHQILNFQEEVLERIGGIAGVRSAAFTYDHPLDATWGDAFRFEGRPEPEAGRWPSAWLRPISPGYFETAGIDLLRGRTLTNTDDGDHPGALVVNEAFIRRYFLDSDVDPLGQTLRLQSHWRFPTPEVFEIVGIVRDVRFLGPAADPAPAYYRPFKQFPESFQKVIVRTETDPLAYVGAVQEAIWAVDPALPIGNISTMAQHYDAAVAQPRFNMMLLALFGGLALLLAAIGVYGLLSYHVAQRRQEIGVRMALGARIGDVVRMVVGEGLWLTGLGVVIGLAGAIGLTRLLGSLLFGVSPLDLATFVAVSIGLASIALVASYLPARRAAKVDPMIALRAE
ncbi:MAG: ABC transporter permease [Vicinamibacterales bacterium]|jgi:putative ABC transport system permease protein|nr:ABC transporter permease [Vicinamibacterales bacterium]MDP6610515.1 ABC transporter permease [Vicinamibacterales bacterium]|tara:strand:+ start:4278 stop:6737 length:2460 start_codon:yes stop_codon:yes gene_type:complete